MNKLCWCRGIGRFASDKVQAPLRTKTRFWVISICALLLVGMAAVINYTASLGPCCIGKTGFVLIQHLDWSWGMLMGHSIAT